MGCPFHIAHCHCQCNSRVQCGRGWIQNNQASCLRTQRPLRLDRDRPGRPHHCGRSARPPHRISRRFFPDVHEITRRRALLRTRRQARPTRPSQRSLRRLEHRCLRLAGINRSHLQIDPLLHHFPQRRRCGHFSRQHLARQLRLQQGISRRLLLRLRRRPSRPLHPLRPGTKDRRTELGMAHRHYAHASHVVARISAIALQLLPRGRSAAHRRQTAQRAHSRRCHLARYRLPTQEPALHRGSRSAFRTSTR